MRWLIGLLLTTLAAQAADYSGLYKGDLAISSGRVENKLLLKMKGKTLTGTLTNQYGQMPIQNGAVDDQDLFFYVVVKDEGEPVRMVYRGHIFEDEIQFKVEAGERQILLVVKKSS